jgi:hypothetical protein
MAVSNIAIQDNAIQADSSFSHSARLQNTLVPLKLIQLAALELVALSVRISLSFVGLCEFCCFTFCNMLRSLVINLLAWHSALHTRLNSFLSKLVLPFCDDSQYLKTCKFTVLIFLEFYDYLLVGQPLLSDTLSKVMFNLLAHRSCVLYLRALCLFWLDALNFLALMCVGSKSTLSS